VGFSPERRFERYEVQLLAIAASTAPRLDHVHNLSKGGARLSSRAAPQAGATYTFLLIIPGTEARTQVVKVPSTVVWSSSFEFGVRFDIRDAGFERFVDRLAVEAPAVSVTRS